MPSPPSHEASKSALGYLYQTEWPLVELARRAGSLPDCSLSLELYDDVSWDQDGTPIEMLQIKHHVNASKGLGDMDPDLWLRIGLWMQAHAPGDPSGPAHALVTTSTAKDGTAAAALRPQTRDTEQARKLLEIAARNSGAEETKSVRTRFLELPAVDREVFIGRIHVIDAAPSIGEDLDANLRKALYLVLPRGHEQVFMDRLWAWWHRLAVDLLKRARGVVSALEFKAKIDDLRNAFAGDNLPTLVERDDIQLDVEQAYSDRPFVEQLRWIALSATLLQKAMIDYYRAYVQSAKWIDDNLIGLDEMARFEADLKDEWERQFEFMKLALPQAVEEDQLQAAGRQLFRFATENSKARIRAYSEPFFLRGKLHELADDARVGWHPEFQARMEALLLGKAS
jgi:hypothetical protein